MCRILYHQQIVALGQCHDAIHITGNTGIVDDNDDFRVLIDERLNGFNRDVRIILAAVGKNYLRPFTQKGDG